MKNTFHCYSAERSQGQAHCLARSLEVKTSANVRKKIREAIPLLRYCESSGEKGEREGGLGSQCIPGGVSLLLIKGIDLCVQHMDSFSKEN